MRLQEISKKMLAKRRRICVDTQTDSLPTIRMKDAGVLVTELKVINKNASVLTDRHENYDLLLPYSISVLRVKEVATSTSDSPPPKQLVLLKDASNSTETYHYDYKTMDICQQDDGVFISNTYTNGNLSDVDVSDLFPNSNNGKIVKMPNMISVSSNTDVINKLVNVSVQAVKEETSNAYTKKCCESENVGPRSMLQLNTDSKNLECSKINLPTHDVCRPLIIPNSHFCPNTFCESYQTDNNLSERNNVSERSVISISIPDKINITIESPSVLESKIQVVEDADLDQKDVYIQTDKKIFFEMSTATDDNLQKYGIRDSGTNAKLSSYHADSKIFRIKNIFQNPHESHSRFTKSDGNRSCSAATSFRQQVITKDSIYYRFMHSPSGLSIRRPIKHFGGKIKASEPIKEERINVHYPLDVVAYTQNDIINSMTLCDNSFIFDDFDELPKTKLRIVSSKSIKPMQELKSIIFGLPSISMTTPEESLQKYANIIDTDIPTLIEHFHFNSPHNATAKYLTTSKKYMCNNSFIGNRETQCPIIKKVNFASPTDALIINSNVKKYCSLNVNRDEYKNNRYHFEGCIEEAILYMRNINSFNKFTNIHPEEITRDMTSLKNRFHNSQSHSQWLRNMKRLEECLSQVKHPGKVLQNRHLMNIGKSAETKFHLAKFSSDLVNNHLLYSTPRYCLSHNDHNRKCNIESNILLERNSNNPKYIIASNDHDDESMDKNIHRKIPWNHLKLQSNLSKIKIFNQSNDSTNVTADQLFQNKRYVKLTINNINSYSLLREAKATPLGRVRKSLPFSRCTITNHDSSNVISKSYNGVSNFIESIDQISRSKDKFKCSVSPRAKFLHLLSERRKIIENSRNTTNW